MSACGKPAEPAGPSASPSTPATATAPAPKPAPTTTFVERKITLVHETRVDFDGNTLDTPKAFSIPVTVRLPDGWEMAKALDGALFDGTTGSLQLRPPGGSDGADDGPYVMISASHVMSTDREVFDRDWTGSPDELAAATKAKVVRYELLRPGQGVYVIEGKRQTEVTSRQWLASGKERPLQVSCEAFLDNADKALIAAFGEACTKMVLGEPAPR